MLWKKQINVVNDKCKYLGYDLITEGKFHPICHTSFPNKPLSSHQDLPQNSQVSEAFTNISFRKTQVNEEENQRIVRAAAAIIREDIRT